jgi:putative FmdB family regulatory protein
MPLYEYRCDACGQQFELIQKFSDPAPDPCPKCGKGPARRLHSSPAIQFKGSGFYITDYAKKGAPSGDDAAPAKPEKKADGGGDTSAKTESAAPAAPAADSGKAAKSAPEK